MAFEIRRGTNVSHWLSQSDRRGAERRGAFTRDDVRKLADLGLDHLRLPIDEEQMWNASGGREPEAWELMNAFLDWCDEAGLRAVVDLHILRCHHFNAPPEGKTLFTDPKAAEHFAALWRDLSAELARRPDDGVAYELMNEAVADDAADWNRVLRCPYEAIRRSEPRRTVVIGSNRWNQAATFDELAVPEDDPHLILTFHYYNPMLITHYRASWVASIRDYDGPLQYPGRPIPQDAFGKLDAEMQQRLGGANGPFDASVMAADLARPLAAARRTRLPLYCGEFGVIGHTPDPIRRAWYRDFRTVLSDNAIAWANWDYRGGFGLFGADGEPTAAADALLAED